MSDVVQLVLADAKSSKSGYSAFLAGCYERLGLTEDTDYWIADAVVHLPPGALRFWYKAAQFQIRGDLAGISAEIDKFRTALGTDIDGLQRRQAAKYSVCHLW